VVLNTRSQIAVAYAPERRLIRLVRGQALFDVAHNAARPFSVDAAGRRTTALGTLFQVRVDLGRLQVVLARGRVSIENQGGTGRRKAAIAYLNPGQAFLASRGAVPRIMRVDVERELRWRDGFVEFDDVTLASAVAEINRYAVRPIRLSDDGVGRLHVSGVFRTGDAKHFVDTVDALLPVQVSETGPGELKLSLTPVPPRILP
jgi:transmembrane sensor